jgi:hypothetical protein
MLSLTSIRVSADTPDRPAIAFNRWSEDWSVLADPDVPREPLDDLKYIPLSSDDERTYLSFGANIRERFEVNDANFGTGVNQQDSYLLSRAEGHLDLLIHGHAQVFFQLQSDVSPGKQRPSPVDQDRVSIEQGFVADSEPLGDGVVAIRIGRQENGLTCNVFFRCVTGRMCVNRTMGFRSPIREDLGASSRSIRIRCKIGIRLGSTTTAARISRLISFE